MKRFKLELFRRNREALETNKDIESYVNGIMDNMHTLPCHNDIEVMVQMLFEKNQDIIFDIYTVECLIDRALKTQSLEWCDGLVECIEKKTTFLSNSCEVVRTLVESATTYEGGDGNGINRS